MVKRGRSGLLEDVFWLAAALPWWVGVLLAAASYVVLHHFAVGEVDAYGAPEQIGQVFAEHLAHTLAYAGQYILPLLLLAGAVASVIGRRKRQELAAKIADGAALRSMDWCDFELAVGEVFRQRGYTVIETGGAGADGGVDLRLLRDGETFLVQCKHWKARKVSVQVVRELYGVMTAQGAVGGFVVTSGVFTNDARSFVRGLNIELIDGTGLTKMIAATQVPQKPIAANVPFYTPVTGDPTCPQCGNAMVLRMAKQGVNMGKAFWGCSTYPQCHGLRAIPACPRCGKEMVWRVARRGANAGKAFWGCSAYPQCCGSRTI